MVVSNISPGSGGFPVLVAGRVSFELPEDSCCHGSALQLEITGEGASC